MSKQAQQTHRRTRLTRDRKSPTINQSLGREHSAFRKRKEYRPFKAPACQHQADNVGYRIEASDMTQHGQSLHHRIYPLQASIICWPATVRRNSANPACATCRQHVIAKVWYQMQSAPCLLFISISTRNLSTRSTLMLDADRRRCKARSRPLQWWKVPQFDEIVV